MTFRIQKSTDDARVILTLAGRIEVEDIAELQRVIHLEKGDGRIALDLQDLTLISHDAVKFLAHCEANNIRLTNCPTYIRKWIGPEKKQA
jgi:anti-anti-sigma regulatory factor